MSVEMVNGSLEVVCHDPDGFGSWLRLLVAGPHDWPTTREVGTPRGGLHLVFLSPAGVHIRNSAGKLGNGIDVRGEGGYVLVPPSMSEHGAYTAQNDLAPTVLPSWLVDLLHILPSSNPTRSGNPARRACAFRLLWTGRSRA